MVSVSGEINAAADESARAATTLQEQVTDLRRISERFTA